MPKIERVEDSTGAGNPLRLTRRKGQRNGRRCKSPSIRVKCGCCDEAVVICFDDEPTGNPSVDTLEINGVMGTVNQWKKVLLPLLGVKK